MMAFNNLDESVILEDEDSFIIDSKDLNDTFNDLFENAEYKSKSFNYNNIKLKYLSSQNVYVTFEKITFVESDIIRYIENIYEKDDKIIISTIEAIKKDNKLVNILTNKAVGDYVDDESIKKYSSKLNKLEYVFSYNDDNYKLISINRIDA